MQRNGPLTAVYGGKHPTPTSGGFELQGLESAESCRTSNSDGRPYQQGRNTLPTLRVETCPLVHFNHWATRVSLDTLGSLGVATEALGPNSERLVDPGRGGAKGLCLPSR